MGEHAILWIIVAGFRIWGSDFYFLSSSYTVRGPSERLKIVSKWTKNKIDIYAVRVIIFWKNKAKKSLFWTQIVSNQKGGSLVFKMINFWTFVTFYFQLFIIFDIFGHFEIHFLRFWDFEILRFWDFEILRFWDFEILRSTMKIWIFVIFWSRLDLHANRS